MKLRTQSRAAVARAGFSLAELMVVIVILGLIATIVVPNLLGRFTVAQKTKAEVDITAITNAVEIYTLENGGRAPDSLEILVTPDENGKTFLKGHTSVPLDPWRNPYQFEPASGGRDFRVFSFGKDGQPGGEGDDADISNETILNKDRR